MKKLLTIILLFLFLNSVYADDTLYDEKIEVLEKMNEILIESIEEIDNIIITNKNKDETYYTYFINKLGKEIEIIENEIDILYYLIFCEEGQGNCTSSVKIDNTNGELSRKEKLQNGIITRKNKVELFEENILLNGKIIEGLEEQKVFLQEERDVKAKEYLNIAEQKLEEKDIKGAISKYKSSCNNRESFECYYGLGLSNFELAKEYYERINNYGYDRLYKKTIKESTSNLEKSLEFTEDEILKQQSTTLKNQVISYPNKEEIVEKPQQQQINAIDKKVDVIWARLEAITAEYSADKKQITYTGIISQLETYKSKNTDKNLTFILNAVIEKLTNAIDIVPQIEEIAVYDRTDDFYKTTLQEKTYSCEISATSDILSTLINKNITEDELIEQIEKSKFSETAQYSNGIYIWGNPDAGFVGYIDIDKKGKIASQRNLTGYGVYEQPIANLYHSQGLKTDIINSSDYTKDFGPEQHLQKLLDEFTKGNYVQLWGDICTTSEYDDGELALADITQEDVDNGKNAKNECWSYGQDRKRVWYYEEDGKLVQHQGLIGEHNFYLLGYEGDIKNPTNIIVWDTSTGKHTYPVKEWMRKWEEMDFRSIIIYSE